MIAYGLFLFSGKWYGVLRGIPLIQIPIYRLQLHFLYVYRCKDIQEELPSSLFPSIRQQLHINIGRSCGMISGRV